MFLRASGCPVGEGYVEDVRTRQKFVTEVEGASGPHHISESTILLTD